MRKVPPRFGVPWAKALPPNAVPANATDISAIASRRVVDVMAYPPSGDFLSIGRKVRAVSKMAGHPVTPCQFAPVRRLLGAKCLCVLAAGTETASRGWIDRARDFALQHDALAAAHR